MNTKLIAAAAEVICAAEKKSTVPVTLAIALDAAGLLQSPGTAAELARLVQDRAQWRTRYYDESRTYWDAELSPGGECCADCYQPVESEPCAEHHPTTVAARLAEENERLRVRVAELETERSRPAPVLPPRAIAAAELVRADHYKDAARLLEDTGQDDDAVNFLDVMADGIRELATEQVSLEDPHDGPLHHTYRLGHDLPEAPRA